MIKIHCFYLNMNLLTHHAWVHRTGYWFCAAFLWNNVIHVKRVFVPGYTRTLSAITSNVLWNNVTHVNGVICPCMAKRTLSGRTTNVLWNNVTHVNGVFCPWQHKDATVSAITTNLLYGNKQMDVWKNDRYNSTWPWLVRIPPRATNNFISPHSHLPSSSTT